MPGVIVAATVRARFDRGFDEDHEIQCEGRYMYLGTGSHVMHGVMNSWLDGGHCWMATRHMIVRKSLLAF